MNNKMENSKKEKEEQSEMLGKFFIKEKKGEKVLKGMSKERMFKLEDKRAHEEMVKRNKKQKDNERIKELLNSSTKKVRKVQNTY